METNPARGHLAALLTIVIWGTTFISTKVLLVDFQPVEILFIRFMMGFLALLAVCPRRLQGVTRRQEGVFALAGLCGVCPAAANFVKMMVVDRWLMHNPEVTPLVALVVCLTLVFTVLCAKVVGCTLPMAAEKLGIDPAVMASPFITTIVDALSLLIYFFFATWILPL